MTSQQWEIPGRIEQDYFRDILEILRRYFDIDRGSGEPVRLLGAPEWLDRYAWQAASRMVTGVYTNGARTWRTAARTAGRGDLIYRNLQQELSGAVGRRMRQLISLNAQLIRSLPQRLAARAAATAAERALGGERAEAVIRELPASLARSRARLIARTEVGKASTTLTQVRAEDLGAAWYVWETSRDGRVRPAHKFMQGVLVRWNDPASPEQLVRLKNPPAPYAPGNIYNCRCYPAPLLRYDQVSWPHKVFYGGSVRWMTLAAFRRIASVEQLPLAA